MKRNKFSLSNYKLLSHDMGPLVPVGWFEVLPGDTIQMATSALLRASPLLSPVYHPIDVRIHHWYVPYRLLWSQFEDFITGGPNGTSLPAYPTMSTGPGGWGIGTLGDYLGFPTGIHPFNGSALPFRAYALIYNEWYRDQDLQSEVGFITTSGADGGVTNTLLRNCSWEKDYFTSSRPWEQKGPAITIPLGTSAPVVTTTVPPHFRTTADATDRIANVRASDNAVIGSGGLTGANSPLQWLNPTGLQTDLTTASAITVNALREALALQRFEEARGRYGSRYVEYLRYLGVRSSDARLQLPEYLGGGRNTIQFSEVMQTAPSAVPDQANTVGALKGHGIGAMRSNRFRRFIEEHGLIMTLMSVRPKTIYSNGSKRALNRRVKEDFWQKELEHIGQQEVLNKEVYGPHTNPDGVFGFQDRYDEYRREESSIAGEFKTTLNYWHLARIFASDPALNSTFVECVPTERVFASNATHTCYSMVKHSVQARRMVSKKGSSFIF